MRTTHVVVLPYDPKWKEDFSAIRAELEDAMGELALRIEHVGSTSVEGMSAKPCIDVDVVIPDRTCLKAGIERLASIGYVHEGNLGIEGREAFCYTGKPHLQLHHLYVCPADSEELRRHITFREFLRQNPDAVKQYSSVKEQAARRFPDDIERYLEYKSPCIAELYRMCGLEERNKNRPAAGSASQCGGAVVLSGQAQRFETALW